MPTIENETTTKRKLTPQKIAMIIVVIVSANVGLQFMGKNKSTENELKELTIKHNKTLPMMLNPDVRMDSLTSTKNSLLYHATLLHIEKDSVDLDALKKMMKDNLEKDVSGKDKFVAFRENKVSIVYRYCDKNKKDLFSITIAPDKFK